MQSTTALRTIEPIASGRNAHSQGGVAAGTTTCSEKTPEAARSILVLQFRYIGDLVLLTPLLHNLRIQRPQARIAVVCEEPFAGILCDQPGIEVITTPRGSSAKSPLRRLARWLRLLRELRDRRFDVVIDTAENRTSDLLVRLTRAPTRVGYSPPRRPRWTRAPYTHVVPPYGTGGRHMVDRFLAPLEALDIPIVVQKPALSAGADATSRIDRVLFRLGLKSKQFAVIHAGARTWQKCWPPERFAAVADFLHHAGAPAVLVGGAEERGLGAAVQNASKRPIFDLIGELSCGELLALLHRCRLFVGNDSGPMHMAAAANVPVVALFGGTPPERWGPVGDHNIVLRPDMPCPCPSPRSCDPLPPDQRGLWCVSRLSIEAVIAAVERQLAASPLAA
jgi:lipopolysaccharide heptosyltransferase III